MHALWWAPHDLYGRHTMVNTVAQNTGQSQNILKVSMCAISHDTPDTIPCGMQQHIHMTFPPCECGVHLEMRGLTLSKKQETYL